MKHLSLWILGIWISASAPIESIASAAEERLSVLIEEAKDDYEPLDPNWRKNERLRVQKSLKNLEKWFQDTGKEALWKKHIQWDSLLAELDRRNQGNPKVIHRSARALFEDIEGIENPVVLSAREALLSYKDALTIGKLPQPRKVFLEKLTALRIALTQLKLQPHSAYLASDVGENIGWLEKSRQVPWLVAKIRSQFNVSNSRLDVSQSYINKALNSAVEQSGKINESVNGGRTTGESKLIGTSSIRLIPNKLRAEFEVRVNGKLQTKSTFNKDLVSALIQSQYDICLTRKFYLEPDGVVGGSASVPRCVRTSDVVRPLFNSILPGVQRKAYEKIRAEVNKNLDEADEKTRKKLKEAFEEKFPKGIESINVSYQENVRDLYRRIGQYPKKMLWKTTKDYLQNRQWRWGVGQIGTGTEAPKCHKNWDFIFRLHHSDLNNILEPLYSNYTWSDRGLKELHNEILGIVPPELQIGDHMRAWEMDFTEFKPFVLEFDENQMRIFWRLEAFRVQDEPGPEKPFRLYETPMQVTVNYDLRAPLAEKVDYGPTGVRKGKVKLQPIDPNADVPKELLKFLDKKFEGIFPKKLQLFGLVPPEGGQFNALLFLNLKEFRAEKGWALFGWEYIPD